jgi:hypothetical protein
MLVTAVQIPPLGTIEDKPAVRDVQDAYHDSHITLKMVNDEDDRILLITVHILWNMRHRLPSMAVTPVTPP